MCKKFISIVLFYALLCSISLAFTDCSSKNSEPALSPITTQATVSNTSVMVYIEPQQMVAMAGNTIQFQIEIAPAGCGISGSEINLKFDPKMIEITGIEEGEILGDSPIVGVKQIDNQVGSLTYALARVGTSYKSPETGTFATIDIKVLDSAKPGTYELSLTSVGLSDEVFKSIDGIVTKGATLEIQQ